MESSCSCWESLKQNYYECQRVHDELAFREGVTYIRSGVPVVTENKFTLVDLSKLLKCAGVEQWDFSLPQNAKKKQKRN